MIRVTWYEDRGERVGFLVTGHAGYARYGDDIVCAAVSALAQTTVLGLKRFLEGFPRVVQRKGYLACYISPELTGEQRLIGVVILGTFEEGVRDIARDYPGHIEIIVKEEDGDQR